MSVWEFIGWMIAAPLALMSALFVIAVSVAVVQVTVKQAKRRIVNKELTKMVRAGEKLGLYNDGKL